MIQDFSLSVCRKLPNYFGFPSCPQLCNSLSCSLPSGTSPCSCTEAVEVLTSPQPGLLDQPLTDPQLTLFVDGSSLIDKSGNRQAAYAVITSTNTVEATHLALETSTQKAELIALTGALQIAKSQGANIYTDSKYAFLIAHTHSALWKERGFLTTKGIPIINEPLLVNLSSLQK